MTGPFTPTITSAELSQQMARPWTRAEREVWRILEQGLLGYTFRRHAVINGVLAGFYCPELGLVVELVESEGAPGQPALAEALESSGIKVARLASTAVNRPNLVSAVESVVGRGRLWPED